MKNLFKKWLHKFRGQSQDRADLIDNLRDAAKYQVIDNDALRMLEGVLRVSQMKVRDIMVARAQMVVIEDNSKLDQILPIIIESAHSRFPVIGESRDEILGLLLAKDLLPFAMSQNSAALSIKNLIRPAVFIPESKRLNMLLKEFRLNRNHMAIVVDEYGGIAGLVTIEDVLEQIVGDIEDEFDIDDDEANIKQNGPTDFVVKALTSIEEFNQYFNIHISNEDFDTIGGYLMQQFGGLPKRGDSITLNGLKFTVLLASKRRLQLVSVLKSGAPLEKEGREAGGGFS